MKRVISIVLLMAMMLTFASCAKDEVKEVSTTEAAVTETTTLEITTETTTETTTAAPTTTTTKAASLSDITNLKKLVRYCEEGPLSVVKYDNDSMQINQDTGMGYYRITNFNSLKGLKSYLTKNLITSNMLKTSEKNNDFELFFDKSGKLYMNEISYGWGTFFNVKKAKLSSGTYHEKYVVSVPLDTSTSDPTDVKSLKMTIVFENGTPKLDSYKFVK